MKRFTATRHNIDRRAAKLGCEVDYNTPLDLAAYAPKGKVFIDSDCHVIVVSAEGEHGITPSQVRQNFYDALGLGLRDCDDTECDYCRPAMIRTLRDLVDFFCADDATRLNRRLYKDTACGASISVELPDGTWKHNGQDWSDVREIRAFTIQTIVEGSDATVDSEVFTLPVREGDVEMWIDQMEAEADRLWHEANDDIEEEEAQS